MDAPECLCSVYSQIFKWHIVIPLGGRLSCYCVFNSYFNPFVLYKEVKFQEIMTHILHMTI